SSSTITAAPVASTAPTLTITVSGSAAGGLVGPLQPRTTYRITVVSTDAGGSGPASAPITARSHAASVVPSTPTGVTARWTAPDSPGDELVATWTAADAGDSPIDRYQVRIAGSDDGGVFKQIV